MRVCFSSVDGAGMASAIGALSPDRKATDQQQHTDGGDRGKTGKLQQPQQSLLFFPSIHMYVLDVMTAGVFLQRSRLSYINYAFSVFGDTEITICYFLPARFLFT